MEYRAAVKVQVKISLLPVVCRQVKWDSAEVREKLDTLLAE